MFSTLVLLVVSILAFIGQSMAQCQDNCGNSGRNRIYSIGHGHDFNAHEYFDTQGYVRGFFHDLIPAVCEAAGLQCVTVWMPYNFCWDSLPGQHPFGGQAIMDKWVDACTGWYQTVDRIHVFDFSMPFTANPEVGFMVNAGSNFNEGDLTGKRIGFMKGWYADEKCLARQQSGARQNYILSVDQIVYKATTDEIMAAMQNDEIDAIFGSRLWFAVQVDGGTYDYLETGSPMSCTLAGGSMIARKDNNDFLAKWNKGFMKLRATGKYQQICQNANEQHGEEGGITCVG